MFCSTESSEDIEVDRKRKPVVKLHSKTPSSSKSNSDIPRGKVDKSPVKKHLDRCKNVKKTQDDVIKETLKKVR